MNRIDDDRPLSGPWSRRPMEAPPKRNDFPGEEVEAGYGSRNEYDDASLPGRNDSPGRGAEAGNRSRSDYDDAPKPNQWNPEREVSTLRREDPENNPVVHGHSFKIKSREPEDAVTEQRAIPECPREAVCEERPNGNDCHDSGHPRALLNHLFSPSGIYAGIIMAEVLGSRGGRNGRQSSVVGRQYRRY
ncbi:MAG: hypothetical protein VR68_10795 [Peptococcaceae bacterium BRH_c4a]|nr:MAG: hypothetical protein VR68_10795 [Peptococcaceae bacterium BRH_c4a]